MSDETGTRWPPVAQLSLTNTRVKAGVTVGPAEDQVMDRGMTGPPERKSVQHGPQLAASVASKATQARCAANARAVERMVTETAHRDFAKRTHKAKPIRRKTRTTALIISMTSLQRFRLLNIMCTKENGYSAHQNPIPQSSPN